MQTTFDLGATLKPLGPCRMFLTYDFAAVITVDTAGAAKAATSVPVKATTVPLRDAQKLYFGSLTKYAIVNGDHAIGVTAVTVLALPAALIAADKAYPWDFLGGTEGASNETGGGVTPNALTAPEQTGDFWHQVTFTDGGHDYTVPIIPGGPYFFKLARPSGSEDGPSEDSIVPVEFACFVVPLFELAKPGTGSLIYDGSSWAPAAPQLSFFYPRCVVFHDDVPRPYDKGGKGLINVHVRPLYYAAGPSGKRGWVRGDPVAKGYTTFRF